MMRSNIPIDSDQKKRNLEYEGIVRPFLNRQTINFRTHSYRFDGQYKNLHKLHLTPTNNIDVSSVNLYINPRSCYIYCHNIISHWGLKRRLFISKSKALPK